MTITTTTVATIWTTVTTLAITLWALTTLTTGRTLNIIGRLLNQYTMRELVLTCLRINLQELNLNVVALLDTSLFNGLKALPVDLADVQQTVLTRHNLNEASVRHDRTNHTVVNLAYLRNSYDSLNLTDSGIDALLVRS
jgi:hypothetical protein